MQSATNRREFVRSIAVGLPVIAATTSTPHMLHALGGHTGERMAPQLDSMLRDFARLHNRMRQRPLGPDDFRAVGAHLRSLAAYHLQKNSDAALITAMRTAAAGDDRDTLLNHRADPEARRRELIAFGFDNPIVTPAHTEPDRAAAIEQLMRTGFSQSLVDGAMAIDSGAMFFQAGPSCPLLAELKTTMEAVAAVTCALAVVSPVFAPECFAASVVLASIALMSFLMNC